MHDDELCADIESRRLLKTIFEKFVCVEELNFREEWAEFLEKNNIKIAHNFICELIKIYARKGRIEERQKWVISISEKIFHPHL